MSGTVLLLAPLPAAMAQQPLIGSVDFFDRLTQLFMETLTCRVSKSFKLGNGTLFLKRNLIGFLLLTPIPYILCCGGVTRWPREIPFVSAPLHKKRESLCHNPLCADLPRGSGGGYGQLTTPGNARQATEPSARCLPRAHTCITHNPLRHHHHL